MKWIVSSSTTPSATLATMTVAMFIEMPRKPMTPSTASTGSTLGAIVRNPNLTDRKTTKITANTVMNARAEAADLRRDQVVIERAEQPSGSGGRRRDAGAREVLCRRARRLCSIMLEHDVGAHRPELHVDLRARVVARDDAFELVPPFAAEREDEKLLRHRRRIGRDDDRRRPAAVVELLVHPPT